MKTKKVQFENVTADEFKEEILSGVKEELATFQANLVQPKKTEYLTRKEVAALFKVSLVTINTWSHSKILNPLKIGGRVRFKSEEIHQALEKSTSQ